MADVTKVPTLELFQWSTKAAPNPRLAAPIDSDDTTLTFTSAPLDEDGNVVTGAFLMGVKNNSSYVETIYVPAGALSVDGLTATGVTRGIELTGLDYTTGDTSNADSHEQDSPVFCNITGVLASIHQAWIQGSIASGGAGLSIGTGADGTITVSRDTDGSAKGWLRWNTSTDKVEYSNDGSSWTEIDDVTASNLVVVSANDTTPGYLNGKLVAGTSITLVEGNDGGDETLTINSSAQRDGVTTHGTYTPAFLTGGSSAESNPAIWDSVTDGEFKITIDGVAYNIASIDFTGDASMADVAATIQAAIRGATSSTETCVWSTDHFVISSVDTTSSSAITVTSTVDTPAGTDISGAGASDYMDCDTGNGTVTNKVLDPTADVGKVALLNANGDIEGELGGVPTGSMTMWLTDTAPSGWILCDGSAQDATADTTLQALFDVIGNTFGGADNTDFQVPDMRGRFALGQDDMGGSSANRVVNAQADTIGGSAGAETHTLTTGEMPAHAHDIVCNDSTFSGDPGANIHPKSTGSGGSDYTYTDGAASEGGGGAHNNMPPYLTVNYIIKK